MLPGAPAAAQAQSAESERAFEFFSPFRDGYGFNAMEQIGLMAVLAVAVVGLLYAFMLMKQVIAADEGTPKMQAIGAAIREGANAYLTAQFKKIGPLIIIITILLAVTFTGSQEAFRWGRAFSFLIGACFSFLVGFVGMRLATTGQPARGRRRPPQLWRGHAAGLPHRHRHRHAHGRPRPPGRHPDLPRSTA